MSAPTLDPRSPAGSRPLPGPGAGSAPGRPPAGPGRGSANDNRSGSGFLLPVLGAAAILSGSSALSVIIEGSTWVLPLVEVVLVITLIGIGCRLIRLPAPGTVAIQAGAGLIALTSLFTSSGYGGVIPNLDVLREMGRLFAGAWDQIRGEVPPAPSTPQINFLIAMAVGLAAIAVDFLVTEADSPALVALPLLCLYSVPASIANDMLPWYSFAAPAALYVALLAVAGHRGRRTGWRAGIGLSAHGALIAVLAIAVALVGAGLVTSVGTTGRLPKTSATTGEVGLSPFANLQQDLQPGATIDVLKVSGLATPDYLRTTALTNWVPNQGWSLGALTNTTGDFSDPLPGTGPTGGTTAVKVSSIAYRDKFLPILAGTEQISGLGSGWSYDKGLESVHRANAMNPQSYTLHYVAQKALDTDLETDTTPTGGPMTTITGVPAEVQQTAQRVTAAATSSFAKAEALTNWFRDPANGFSYSVTVPPGNSGDALVDFLHNKKGYCEQYASALAVMLRTLGIPARVAIGFTQGDQQADGSYIISNHDAHAWVEVDFTHNGWVRFDPTPLVNGQGGEQGFQAQSKTTPTTSSSDTSTTSSSKASITAQGPQLQDDPTTVTTTALAGSANSGGGDWLRVVGWSALGALVVFAILILPTALRQRKRRQHLSVARSGQVGSASAAWTEIEDTALDLGLSLKPDESARSASNRFARTAQLGTDERAGLREVVLAAEHEWYAAAGTGAGSADGTGPSGQHLERAVHRVALGMRRNVKIGAFDRWWPRSLTRSARG